VDIKDKASVEKELTVGQNIDEEIVSGLWSWVEGSDPKMYISCYERNGLHFFHVSDVSLLQHFPLLHGLEVCQRNTISQGYQELNPRKSQKKSI